MSFISDRNLDFNSSPVLFLAWLVLIEFHVFSSWSELLMFVEEG